jgi:signal transduction histidine kinase
LANLISFTAFFLSRAATIFGYLPTEGGTGLDLALSKELALLINGDLTVESTWGQGGRK